MKAISLLTAIALVTMMTSCNDEYLTTYTNKTVALSPYTELNIEDAINVLMDPRATEVTIKATEDEIDDIICSVNDEGELTIERKWSMRFTTHDVWVTLPLNSNLRKVDLSGASEFKGDLNGTEVSINASGASDVVATCNATDLEIDLSGASSLMLSGHASSVEAELSGASDMNSTALTAYDVYVRFSGSSDGKLYCDHALTGSLSGASTLGYTGTPQTVNVSTSGASEVFPL